MTSAGCEVREHAASQEEHDTTWWHTALSVLFPSVPTELTGVAHRSLELTRRGEGTQ
jgi:hypothetical protein